MSDPLPLSTAISKKVSEISIGLESGKAPILDMVSDTTRSLLEHWFFDDITELRSNLNFHKGQKQAILNTIYLHEIIKIKSLKDSYQLLSPHSLIKNEGLLLHTSKTKNSHPKYCHKMATGTGKTWVLQALLIWQVLNKINEPSNDRFTKNFLIVTPGLIVYDRLLDAFKGKVLNGIRDFNTSDIKQYGNLFIPEKYKEIIYNFVLNNTCEKNEIGTKITSDGLIAITNWNALIIDEKVEEIKKDSIITLGADFSPSEVIRDLFPITPSLDKGNALENLDNKNSKKNLIEFLKGLNDLLNFNDEAHHIHEIKIDGELTEVEWQKSLLEISSNKEDRFIQIDFSATPYNQAGTGKNSKKIFFPHIISNFDLSEAIKLCLVKSIALDIRSDVDELEELTFKADRDASGNIELSDGQRKMLRAGIVKLKKLEEQFNLLNPNKIPKMLVVCEDIKVTKKVYDFFLKEGFDVEDIINIDSGKKQELSEKEWTIVKEKLFNIDKHKKPKIIINVLMLREGFDVNNICVIVPLRSSQANILLEQIVGRGLRLMWRDEKVYEEIRKENRELMDKGSEPKNLIDILSIVEHPRFKEWYNNILEGLVGNVGENSNSKPIGDLINAELVKNFEDYDFNIPIIIRDAEEIIDEQILLPNDLKPFSAISFNELKKIVGKGDDWISTELQSSTLFGKYKVEGSILNVSGYNDYLSRITKRISYALSDPFELGKNLKISKPYIGFNTVKLANAIDIYIKNFLFEKTFDPLHDENWRLLMINDVFNHIVKEAAVKFEESFNKISLQKAHVEYKPLSVVKNITVSYSSSIETKKSIFNRLPYPKKNGGLELKFMQWCNNDSSVHAYCKIHEYKHDFLWLRFIKEDGMLGRYSPDFIVRCEKNIYLVETKSQSDISKINVQKKLKAAALYCVRINELDNNQRQDYIWSYALIGENKVDQYIKGNGTVKDLLELAKVRIN